MSNEPIPGVIPLIQRGIAIYKEEFNTLVGLNALYLAFSFLGIAAFIGSILLLRFSAMGVGVVGFGLLSIVGIAAVIVFWWLLIRILLATLYTIRDYDEHLSMREAFARGRGKVWSFLWVMVLTMLAVMGSMAIVFLVGTVILFPIFFVAPTFVYLALFGFVGVGAFVAIIVTATWFAFSTWLFVDQNARGLHALALSKHLSENNLGQVMWRVFCVSVISVLFYGVVQIILHLIFGFLPYQVDQLYSQIFSNIILCVTLIPVLYCTMFSLYISVEANEEVDTDSKKHGEHRGMLAILIFFGFLAVCLLPVIIGPSLENQSHYANEGYAGTDLMQTP